MMVCYFENFRGRWNICCETVEKSFYFPVHKFNESYFLVPGTVDPLED